MTSGISLTKKELALVVEALDSHAYWQLSDQHYRRDGFVDEPGSDDPEIRRELRATNRLHDKLEAALHTKRTVRAKTAPRRAEKARKGR